MAAATAVGGCAPVAAPSEAASGAVIEVIDGDTVEVAGVGRVRLIGIDTPERGECGYAEAKERLADLVTGETVTLVPGAQDDVDRYDRLLRYVEVDGLDVGEVLLDEGWAESRYDSRDGYGEHERERAYVEADAGTSVPPVCPSR